MIKVCLAFHLIIKYKLSVAPPRPVASNVNSCVSRDQVYETQLGDRANGVTGIDSWGV